MRNLQHKVSPDNPENNFVFVFFGWGSICKICCKRSLLTYLKIIFFCIFLVWFNMENMQHKVIHSKSGPGDTNRAANKFELSANFSKNCPKILKNDPKWPKYCPKWPKMALEWPKMIQSGPKMTPNGPKLAQMAQKWRLDLRTFSANFFDWKSGSANFFAFRMYGWCAICAEGWWRTLVNCQLLLLYIIPPVASVPTPTPTCIHTFSANV